MSFLKNLDMNSIILAEILVYISTRKAMTYQTRFPYRNLKCIRFSVVRFGTGSLCLDPEGVRNSKKATAVISLYSS